MDLNILGMNLTAVPDMVETVKGYVGSVNKTLDELDTLEEKNAYAGEFATKLKQYVSAVRQAAEAVTNVLMKFCEYISKAETEWQSISSAQSDNLETAQGTITAEQ